MTSSEKDSRRAKLQKNYNKWLTSRLLENLLPTDENDFYGSAFHSWIERIENGKKKELEWLEKHLRNIPDEYIDDYAEDISKADALSDDMYAALLVNIWSTFETMFSNCIKAWNIDATSPLNRDMHRIKVVKETFTDDFSIPFENSVKYKYANAVRCMANSYKHNNGRYHPDNNPIDQSLLTAWDITEGKKIEYSNLPIFEILTSCGSYAGSLLEELSVKISESH